MSPVFKMPEIAESIVEGEIGRWAVKERERVKKDQILLEVLTDKVNVEIPSPFDGTVTKLLVAEGSVVKVGTPILEYTVEGELEVSAPPPTPPAAHEPAKKAVSAPTAVSRVPGVPVKAAPAVRALARSLGVDIETITGSGPDGRITKEDVENAAKGIQQAPPASAVTASVPEVPAEAPPPIAVQPPAPPSMAREERLPFRGKRRMIAQHLRHSLDTAAHTLYVEEVDVTELVSLKDRLQSVAEKQGLKLTYLAFITKATALTLKDHPYLNASLDEEKGDLILKRYYNIGIAVDTPEGLIVPNVKNADTKSIFDIAREIQDLSNRARANRLRLDEVEGGTFSITSAGSIGGLLSMPLIAYPECAILGVHRIRKRPVVIQSQIVIRDIVNLSVTFDHRIVDGAEVARFVKDLGDRLSAPELLLLG